MPKIHSIVKIRNEDLRRYRSAISTNPECHIFGSNPNYSSISYARADYMRSIGSERSKEGKEAPKGPSCPTGCLQPFFRRPTLLAPKKSTIKGKKARLFQVCSNGEYSSKIPLTAEGKTQRSKKTTKRERWPCNWLVLTSARGKRR